MWGAWGAGAGSCLAEHPQSSHVGVHCCLLHGPAPQEGAALEGSVCRLRGTACQGLQAASGIDSTNMTLRAGAGPEAGSATEEQTAW